MRRRPRMALLSAVPGPRWRVEEAIKLAKSPARTAEPWKQSVAAHPGRRHQLRVAVKVATDAATKAGLDTELHARAAVREVLESWGLVWGRDVYGPEIDPATGELRETTGQYVTPGQL